MMNNYSVNHQQVFALLARLVVEKPHQLAGLLSEYNLNVDATNQKGVQKQLLRGIQEKGTAFLAKLAALLNAHLLSNQKQIEEDSINTSKIFSRENQFLGEANPVSAIAGSIGAIANLIGSKKQNELLSRQVQNQKIQSFLASRQQAEQRATSLHQQKLKQQKHRSYLKAGIAVALMLFLGWLVIYSVK